MGKMVLNGPPWSEYVDEDEAYLLGQVGSLGSGLLAGREFPEYVVQEVREEVHRIQAQRQGRGELAARARAAAEIAAQPAGLPAPPVARAA
jgi:hypothetical protein